MAHRNAPLTPEGRRRLVSAVSTGRSPTSPRRPGCPGSAWGNGSPAGASTARPACIDSVRAPAHRPTGPHPRSSSRSGEPARRMVGPTDRPGADPTGVAISAATFTRWLRRLGLRRLDPSTPTGSRYAPRDDHRPLARRHGARRREEGRPDPRRRRLARPRQGLRPAPRRRRAKSAGARAGYAYLHSAVDGFSRLGYTEPLTDENAATAVAFLARAPGVLRRARHHQAHPRRDRQRVLLPRQRVRRPEALGARHKRTKPYTPKHNGKVERYQRTLAGELLYAHPWDLRASSAPTRSAPG